MSMFGKNTKSKSDVTFESGELRQEDGHCFIAGNVHIVGEIRFSGTLRLDGRVDGKVSAYKGKKGSLIISNGACVNGPVDTTELISDGSIYGDVKVLGRMECRAKSLIQGEVQYGTIQIAEGAQLMGKCVQKDNPNQSVTTHTLATRNSGKGRNAI